MLINKTKVKQYALDCAAQRAHKFTRVSKEFLDSVEATVRQMVAAKVAGHPSLGKTLK